MFMASLDVWNTVALQERQIRSIETLWRLGLIERSSKLSFIVAYYKVSNTMLKTLLKLKVRFQAFLHRKRK
jgi:hypothetical protein